MNIFELSDQEQNLYDLLTAELPEEALTNVSQEDIEARQGEIIDGWLSASGDFKAKVDGYCNLMEILQAKANLRLEQAGALQRLAAADTNLAMRLKARLKAVMEARGETKLETSYHKLTIAKNGGTLPLIVNPAWERDPAGAPEQFHKVRVTLDHEAIREALRNDEPVEGCALGERGTHLRIR